MRVRWALLLVLAIVTTPVLLVVATYVRWWWAGGFAPDSERLPPLWMCIAIAREAAALTLTVVGILRPTERNSVPVREAPMIVLLADNVLGLAAQNALSRRLRARGWSTQLFRPSAWRLPTADAARELDAFVRSAAPAQAVFIAFGHAGVLVRYFLRRYRAAGIRRVVTIGTAHQRGQASSVPLMDQLSAGDRVPQQFEVIAIASDFDACISPPTRAYYPGAFNIEVRGLGHFSLARSPRVVDLIIENLGAKTKKSADDADGRR